MYESAKVMGLVLQSHLLDVCWYWDRFGSLITAVARNPSLTKQLFSYSIFRLH
jgi:hypothetical protein